MARDVKDILKNYQPSTFLKKDQGSQEQDDFHVTADHSNFITYKYQMKYMVRTLGWLKFFVNLKIARGMLYIRFLQEKIRISKKLFLIELELGEETLICKDMQLEHLPKSYHYYDGILNYIKESISKEKLKFFSLKSTMQNFYDKRSDVKLAILKLFCAGADEGEELTFKPQVVNKKSRNEIDHRPSPHITGVQKSDYIVVSCNIL